ncbi:MAG TPA: serine hydrolase, partial [Flavobacteriales bacterium]|nr:serine hydrolase [Flavobacteriales bacterium]
MDRYQVRTPFVVGVVVGDQVRYSRAFGSLDLSDTIPATTTTPFYIASSTKAFVGLTTAILAEQGIIDLDGTLAHYLPELHFLDTAIHPERITLRQLLTHTHGIANPVVGFNAAYTGLRTSTEELMTDLASESVAVPLTFDYSNDGYLISALILERVTGKDWKHLVQELILDPAGMKGTSARVSSYPRSALPPAFKGSRSSQAVEDAPFVKTDSTMHAAGGMICTVEDACLWLALNLNDGRIGGEQVIPAKAIARTHRTEVTL